jgi:hypothetical protein
MIIYKITNLLNGKTYVGMDAKNCANYFGSGVAIKAAIKKYGKSNFVKEILESGFTSYEEMALAEIRWILKEKVTNPYGIYNLNDGGLGASSNKGKVAEEIYGKDRALKIKNKISNTLKSKGIKPPSRMGMKGSEKQRQVIIAISKSRKKTQKEIDALIARTARSIVCVENGNTYSSILEASIVLSVSSGNICSVLKGKRRTAGGFTFKYAENE